MSDESSTGTDVKRQGLWRRRRSLAFLGLLVLPVSTALAQSVPSLSSRMFDNEKTDTATPSVNFLFRCCPLLPHPARHRQRRDQRQRRRTSTRWTSTATATSTW